MSSADSPAPWAVPEVSWTDPEYVATVVAVLATGALYFYSALASSGPTAGEITFVLLAVFLPAGVAYELARRWG